MFEHVVVLLSFVYAIALTHLLSSATELIWSRDRVRPSGRQILWMFNALLGLLLNWTGMFYESQRSHWEVADVAISFVAALVQYFTCSLISMRVKEEGVIEMPAFFERQRPFIFAAFLALTAFAMFQNWWNRDLMQNPNDLIYVEITIFPMLVFIALAGWARPVWLQWLAGIGFAALIGYFLFTYALS